ncbi:MAG: energy transducer TonB [Bacteroidota bacterium]
MKQSAITLLVVLLFLSGFSQNSRFEYTGRYTPEIKKAKLNEARFVYEIMPQFSRFFVLPYNEHTQFDKQVVTVYPQSSFYPQDNYNYLFNYISVEIAASSNGKVTMAQSSSDTLTPEQKNILALADLGTDISIKIKFKYKNEANEKAGNAGNMHEGAYAVTVIPQTEAAYPGGFKQFSEYLTQNVFSKFPEPKAAEKIQQAILKFTVDEEGQIVDARIARTSTDLKIDELLLDATNKMPKWMPAQISGGIRVKQEFSIPLGGGGC